MDPKSPLVNLPAFCRQCGQPFQSGFAAGGNRTISMEGCTSGPCPHCGYPVGDVPDASYHFVDGALAFIGELQPSTSDLQVALEELTKAVREQNTDVEAIRRRLDERAPSAAPITQLLRDPAVGNVLMALTLVATIIMGILNQ